MDMARPLQLKDLSDSDQKLLAAALDCYPAAEREKLQKIFESDNPSLGLLNILPDAAKGVFEEALTGDAVDRALALYRQCRLFEARELLHKTLSLCVFPDEYKIQSAFVNNAADFSIKRARSTVLELLGEVEWELGNSFDAASHYEQAIILAEETGDINARAKSMHGFGVFCFETGEIEQGIDLCNQALGLLKNSTDDWQARKKILASLSSIYSSLGQYADALQYANQSIEEAKRYRDRGYLAVCFNNLGNLYADMDEPEQAIKAYEDGIIICRQENSLRNEAFLSDNLAMLLVACGELSRAEELVGRAEGISRQIDSVMLKAQTLVTKGVLCRQTGRHEDACRFFNDAIALYHASGAQGSEAFVYALLGSLERDCRQDLQKACNACEQSIALIEKMRGSIKREVFRIQFADSNVTPYEIMIDCLIRRNEHELAIDYVERAKSRALIDLLSGVINESAACKIDSAAYEKTCFLLNALEEIRKNMEALYRKEEADEQDEDGTRGGHDNLLRALSDELVETEAAFQEALQELDVIDPDFVSLAQVRPFGFNEIKATLDEETLALEVYQTGNRLCLFLVARSGILKVISVDLTLQDAMDIVAGVIESLRDKSALDTRSHEFLRNVRQPLSQLYEKLIAPLSGFFSSYKRLVIAPHLFWHYFPFHALYDKAGQQYLCDQIEIGYCQSVSVLNLCRKKNLTGRDHALILCGNSSDLPFVSKEADCVADAFRPHSAVYKKEAAHLGHIERSAVPFDIVHLACHGEFNAEQPFLSNIQIAPGESEQRNTYLLDLFNVQLPCSLVTLSACDTGLSQINAADEIIGLSRGLFFAGAAAVMLSLWKVADESTSMLMEQFYCQYAKGQTKTRSLQLAMQGVRNHEKYRHPYYWAPFVVMGEWQ